MPHPGHEKHLCLLQNTGYLKENFADYKSLVKDSKYVCKSCGRTAPQVTQTSVPLRHCRRPLNTILC
jgi:hypothetical protein